MTTGDAALDAGAILTSAPLAIVVVDPSGHLTSLNPAALRLLGPGADGLLGEPALALFPPASAAASLAQVEAAADGKLGHLELVLRRPGGGEVEVGASFSRLPGSDDAPGGIVCIAGDITQRKRDAAELRQLADNYRHLAQATDVAMYRYEFPRGSMRVDFVNPAFERITGLRQEDLQRDPSPLWERTDPEGLARFDAARRSAEPLWPVEFRWQRGDGQWLSLASTELLIRDDDGRVVAALGISHDLTGLERQERALADALTLERAATERLRRVDDVRRLFLQAVSHELRTPLTAVVGFAETLRDRHAQLEPRHMLELTGRIHAQASKLQALLDDLLDIERLTRGVVQLTRRRVDVAGLVAAVVVEQGDPTVDVVTVPSPGWVDAAKVERIVVNLIANAHKHAGAGARVHVDVRPDGEDVVITVEDDGPGIPDELRETLFDAFTQGPQSTHAPSPGTGIGLTLVAEFARLHGGTAEVREASLGGAAFVVRLPASGAVA